MTNPSVAKFRQCRKKPRRITTPSGHEFIIKVLTPMDYIKAGLDDLPNEFFQFIFAVTTGQKSNLSPEEEKKNYEMFEKFLGVTVSEGVIDPPTIIRYDKEREDTHLLWGEIPPKDQEYIMGCISGRITDGEPIEEAPKPEENREPEHQAG